MNTTTQPATGETRSSAPKQQSAADRRPERSASSSQQADEAAKRGEPLSAEKPRDRSPKQENL